VVVNAEIVGRLWAEESGEGDLAATAASGRERECQSQQCGEQTTAASDDSDSDGDLDIDEDGRW